MLEDPNFQKTSNQAPARFLKFLLVKSWAQSRLEWNFANSGSSRLDNQSSSSVRAWKIWARSTSTATNTTKTKRVLSDPIKKMLRNRLVASILWMFVVSLTFNRHLQLFLRQNFCRHEKLKATRATKIFWFFARKTKIGQTSENLCSNCFRGMRFSWSRNPLA